jgi:tetratricopeptide (TPR) repeat protein
MRRGVLGAVALVLALAWPVLAAAQPRATVREYQKVFTTYPYSDPNPIPTPGRIYPYYRFDMYTDTPAQRSWTVVELENAYVRVQVLPQIGGKIWSAVEKASGRAFIYDNQVVKFRDIAMRGPWTSGGIEANYGIIGHTPNCATPVDYVTRQHQDGSASVTIGVLDLLTRTPWRLEIALPPDKAYFTTRSLWQNSTPLEQPYYTWMNAGLKAAGNLQFVYPGTHYLGHDGEASPWPTHPQNGKDLSFYEQNDFGPYKSYHVVGRHTDFFGAYWHDDDFGMARYSTRDDKPGKKIWIWGLSRQGMIWEQLLTDTSGQYVEVQSGRLFNQSAEASSLTPFKHRGFAPAATDVWTEFWLPVKGTRGLVKANDVGALNVRREAGTLWIHFMAVQPLADTLQVFDGERLVLERALTLAPMEAWQGSVSEAVPDERLYVRVGTSRERSRFEYRGNRSEATLSRPIESPRDFDWESVYGLYLKGKEHVRQRAYALAGDALQACLKRDPNFTPALVDLAALRYRAMDYQGAYDLARRALSIDTYDPGANYHYGLAAEALGRAFDARDGFELAAQAVEFRAAAWQRLARLALREGRLQEAAHYAGRAVEVNVHDVDARLLLALARRLDGDVKGAGAALDAALAVDPLNHHAVFERALLDGGAEAERAFVAGIRNEMPRETFLELAAWYRGLNRLAEAERVLALGPESPEVLYWLAFVQDRQSKPAARQTLARATAASPSLVFPFRPESVAVLAWAGGIDTSWRPKYYLALIHLGLGNTAEARHLLEECGEQPDFAPFYAARAQVRQATAPARALEDLRKALALDAQQWRFSRMLAERLVADAAYAEALDVASRAYAQAPANYILGMLAARTLSLNGRYRESADLLGRLRVLPYEGANDGQRLHREAQLMLAVEALGRGDRKAALDRIALARTWPEHLGAGKPYPENVDERVEDWLELRSRTGMRTGGARGTREAREAQTVLDRVAADTRSAAGAGGLARALALRDAGKPAEAAEALEAWARATAEAGDPGPGESTPRRARGGRLLAEWGRAVFAGQTASLPGPRHAAGEYAVIATAVAVPVPGQ